MNMEQWLVEVSQAYQLNWCINSIVDRILT
jgi:hypothetical protein